MKKSIRILAVAMIAVMLCLCLASCGKTLSGEYAATLEAFGLETGKKMSFSGKNVTVSYVVANHELASVDGTYTIEDEKITFDFVDEDQVENEDAKDFLAGLTGSVSFEEGDGYKVESLITYRDTTCFALNRYTVEKTYERKSSGRACCIAITKGSGVFKADGKVLEVKAGDCLFEPAKTVDYIIEASETLEVLECMPPEM